MKECPKCSKSVEDDSWLCECGYEFSAGGQPVAAAVPHRRPVCRFFASLLAVPVSIALGYLFFVLMPSGRGGSGPDVGADLRGVLPVFVIIILGPIGIILSIAALSRHERYAGILLAFYALVALAFFVH